jgi:hypothetical protein
MSFQVINLRQIVVTITVDESGFMSIEARGPLDGNRGLVQLLDEARKIAVRGKQDVPPGRLPPR